MGRAGERLTRVTHVITGLAAGGAEAMLYKLVEATRTELSHSVVSLVGGGGVFAEKLAALGIPVASMGMRRGVPDPLALLRLTRWLRLRRPDLVQSWMYHANLLAGCAALAAGRIPIVWGVHHSTLAPGTTKTLTRLTAKTCAWLSGVLPSRIVCCARSTLETHAALGYRGSRMVVIFNGFDLGRIARDARAGARVRQELSIPATAPVIGWLGRIHPDKDPRTFLAAARQVAEARGDATFVLAGAGVDASNATLGRWVDELAVGPRVRLLGFRRDVPALLSAMDVLALSSTSEAFPNVLGEAMACGVHCVATDCGDSAEIVGTSGRIVPRRDPTAMAGAILELLALDPESRATLRASGLQRVRASYDMKVIAGRYTELYAQVLEESAARAQRGVISRNGR